MSGFRKLSLSVNSSNFKIGKFAFGELLPESTRHRNSNFEGRFEFI